MKGLPFRGPRWWSASAQTSLPVPDSPVMNTVALLGAALSMILYTPYMGSDEPMKPQNSRRPKSSLRVSARC